MLSGDGWAVSAGWYHQEEVVASVGSEEPSDTSSSEQREGEGGSNRAVFSHSAGGTGTFILLDFTLPWLLLIVLVSGQVEPKALPKHGTYPSTLPKVQV